MLNTIKLFNDQKGRFSRYNFWVDTLIIQVLLLIIVILLSFLGGMFNIELLVQISSFAGMLGMLYISFTSYIKRLHDLDKSGWMSLLLFVPLANIYLFIICGFFKGTKGKNKYGDDPLVNNSSSIPDEL